MEPSDESAGRTEPSDESTVRMEPSDEYAVRMEPSDESADRMKLPRFVCNALYVADLDPDFVTDDILLHFFGQVGNVLSVKLCSNTKSAEDLSYAYVNYSTTEEACAAWRKLSYKRLNGIPIRILFSNLDHTSRYNQNANLIIRNLEESLDSEALHHIFSFFGVVISCKVKLDSNRKSLGHGFIQYQDEEDAQRAIKMVNGKLLQGKQVYVGPFIPRSKDSTLESTTNLILQDLKPAHITSGASIHEASLCSGSSSNGSSSSNAGDEDEAENEILSDERSSHENGDDDLVAFKARAAEMIQSARDAIVAEKRAATPHIDPSYVPSSEPWDPQPWSVETLRANLARARLPEERRAMLASSLLPLVWTCTLKEEYAPFVTDELVRSLDVDEIARLMVSTEELQRKVEATTEMTLKRIRDQPPFVPQSALEPPTPEAAPATPKAAPATPNMAPSTPNLAPSTPKMADVKAQNVDPFTVNVEPITVAKLPVFQFGTGVFQVAKAPTFRNGTGFFDVSRNQQSHTP